MQISGFRQSSYASPVQPRAQRTGNPFEQALSDAGSRPAINDSSLAPAASGSSQGGDKADFSNMTPRQFVEAGKKMYKEGKIDLDQLFKVEFAAGALNQDQSSLESTTPVNYVKHFQDQLRAGTQYYGEYGYHKIEDLVKIITQ